MTGTSLQSKSVEFSLIFFCCYKLKIGSHNENGNLVSVYLQPWPLNSPYCFINSFLLSGFILRNHVPLVGPADGQQISFRSDHNPSAIQLLPYYTPQVITECISSRCCPCFIFSEFLDKLQGSLKRSAGGCI